MVVKSEIREERTDVFSFWEMTPTIENGKIVQVETKLEETTLVELQKRIEESEKQIVDATAKIALDKSKIALINAL